MRKIFSKLAKNKFAVASSAAFCSAVAFAEGATSGISSSLVTDYITDGKTQVVSVLTAGAAIVGAFFVWGLIKKALNRSK